MRHTTITLAVVTAISTLMLWAPPPAEAVPTSQLPDADLFCGTAYADKVAAFIALPSASSQWIDDPVYGGHYIVLTVAHYLAPGLLTGPVADLSALQLLETKTYGTRDGLTDGQIVQCQVVSRFAPSDITVIAPITMARVP
jgi:hypothetical protein